MFVLPEKYHKNTPIDIKTFVKQADKKADKEKIRNDVVAVRLSWQIFGEEIPSFHSNDYNCPVIMGLDVQLKSMKTVANFAELLQHMVKAPCVIRFYDHAEEVYSFAHKRLNAHDSEEIVIVNRVETPRLSLTLPDKTAEKLKQYLAFDALLNKSDKLSLYLEATVKAYIVSNPKLFSGIDLLLDGKVWYNKEATLVLFGRLLELERLKCELKSEKLPGVKVRLNGEIKEIIERLRG
jgi:hypothetical protein